MVPNPNHTATIIQCCMTTETQYHQCSGWQRPSLIWHFECHLHLTYPRACCCLLLYACTSISPYSFFFLLCIHSDIPQGFAAITSVLNVPFVHASHTLNYSQCLYGCTAALLHFYCFNFVSKDKRYQRQAVMRSSSVTYQRWPALKSVNPLSSCSSSLLFSHIPWISPVWSAEIIPKMGFLSLFELRMFAPIWSHMPGKFEQRHICMNATKINLKLIFISFLLSLCLWIITVILFIAGFYRMVKRPRCYTLVGK